MQDETATSIDDFSFVGGFASFGDFETSIEMDADKIASKICSMNKQSLRRREEKDACVVEKKSQQCFDNFLLKPNSPPPSPDSSLNDESTLSLAKLEGLQSEVDDFLYSQTDEEGEQRMKDFLNLKGGQPQPQPPQQRQRQQQQQQQPQQHHQQPQQLQQLQQQPLKQPQPQTQPQQQQQSETTINFITATSNFSILEKTNQLINQSNHDSTLLHDVRARLGLETLSETLMNRTSNGSALIQAQHGLSAVQNSHASVPRGVDCFLPKKKSVVIMKSADDLDETPCDGEESRISSRYFLAASTPFLPSANDQTNALDSLCSPTISHFSPTIAAQEDVLFLGNKRDTMTEFKMGEVSADLIPGNNQDDTAVVKNENASNNSNSRLSQADQNVSNWLEGNFQNQDVSAFFGDAFGDADEGFGDFNQDFEHMLQEDEKLIKEANDTINKDTTGTSDWSICTRNLSISSALIPTSINSINSDGNVTRYFKDKSEQLGQSIGKAGDRPRFSETDAIFSPQKLASCDKRFSDVGKVVAQNDGNIGLVTSKSDTEASETLNPCVNLKKFSNLQLNCDDSDDVKDSLGKEIFSIPVSEQEAENLLCSIQEKRVSIVGVEKSKIEVLAKTISLLTGTDIDAVLKILHFMSKENHMSMGTTPHVRKLDPVFENTFQHISGDVKKSPDTTLTTTDVLYHTLYPTVDSADSFSNTTSTLTNACTNYKCATVLPYQNAPLETLKNNNGGYFQLPSSRNSEQFSPLDSISTHAPQGGGRLTDVVQYQNKLKFDVCCIGEKAIKLFQMSNTSSTWVQIHLQVILSTLNGQVVHDDEERSQTFTISPAKVVVGPNQSEEVKVKFLPQKPGNFMVKVELLVCHLVNDERKWQKLNKLVDIEGVCEVPDLEVVYGENKSNCFDFGQMSYGSSCCRELKIVNKGKANVPVRLSIFPTSSTVHFSFSKSPMLSKISESPPVVTTTVPGRGHTHKGGEGVSKPTVIKIQCTASYHSVDHNKQQLTLPEEHSSQLDIKTDTEHMLPITSHRIKVSVGFQRLYSLRSLQPIFFSCVEGAEAVEAIPLRNAGNLIMNMEIRLSGDSSFYLISSSQLTLQPGEDSDLKLLFKGKSVGYYEATVIVSILPDGEQYEWTLKGTLSKPVVTKTASKKPSILSNTLALNWSGVAIGQSEEKKLFLRNSSEKHIELSLTISGEHTNFQIVGNQLVVQKEINKFKAEISPKGELPVHVLFLPTYLDMAKASLVLRTVDGGSKFVIPLIGYGGKSQLDISGAKNLHNQFWIDMDEINLGKKNVMNLILRNSGSRAAFVSIKCFVDITSRLEYPNTHVCIMPNNFVLKEKVSTQVTLTYQPLQEHAMKLLQDGKHANAHLVIYSGDEVLRKEHKRKSHVFHDASIINELDCTFSNEDNIGEEVAYQIDSADWINFFDSSINKTVIALVARERNNTLKNKDAIVSLPQKVETENKLPVEEGKWCVSPEKVILTGSKDSSIVKLNVRNSFDRPLSFEFIWPAETLIVMPCKGKISPHTEVVVQVSARTDSLPLEDVPWKGNIYVQCNGEQKSVAVEIREDIFQALSQPSGKRGKVDAASKLPPVSNGRGNTPSSIQSEMATNEHQSKSSNNDVSLVPHLKNDSFKKGDAVENILSIIPPRIEISDTKVNMSTESAFTIMNKSTWKCAWIIKPLGQPLCNNTDGKVAKVKYPVFVFSEQSGFLSGKKMIQVFFRPLHEGMYSQVWEIEINSNGRVTDKTKLEVNARCINTLGNHCNVDDEKQSCYPKEEAKRQEIKRKDINRKSSSKLPENGEDRTTTVRKSMEERSFFVKDTFITFPQTNVGEAVSLNFRLCNKSDKVRKVKLSAPQPPFFVDQNCLMLTIRPKAFLRVPVRFSPHEPDTVSEGKIIVSLENGDLDKVSLVGKSGVR